MRDELVAAVRHGCEEICLIRLRESSLARECWGINLARRCASLPDSSSEADSGKRARRGAHSKPVSWNATRA
jgi:hypothetical protein